MRLVVERVGLGFVVCLIFETFVAAVQVLSVPAPRSLELLRSTVFSLG